MSPDDTNLTPATPDVPAPDATSTPSPEPAGTPEPVPEAPTEPQAPPQPPAEAGQVPNPPAPPDVPTAPEPVPEQVAEEAAADAAVDAAEDSAQDSAEDEKLEDELPHGSNVPGVVRRPENHPGNPTPRQFDGAERAVPIDSSGIGTETNQHVVDNLPKDENGQVQIDSNGQVAGLGPNQQPFRPAPQA